MLRTLLEKNPIFFSGILKSNTGTNYPFTSKPESEAKEFYKNPCVMTFREALKLFSQGASLCIELNDNLSAGKYLDLGAVYASQVLRFFPQIFEETLNDIESMILTKKVMLYRALFTNGFKHPLLAQILNQEEIRDYVFNKETENTYAPENIEINIQHHIDRLWVAYYVTGNDSLIDKMRSFFREDLATFQIAQDVSANELSIDDALENIQNNFAFEITEKTEKLLINCHIIYTFEMNQKDYLR